MKSYKSIKMLLKKVGISFLILLLYIRVFIPLIINYFKVLEKCFKKDYNLTKIKYLIDCLKTIYTNKIIGLICFIIALILILIVFNILLARRRLKIENEGIKFKDKDGTHGTASFTSPNEISILDIGNEKNVAGLVLGKTIDTDEIITLPDSNNSVNRNIMVWGASGSGKSTSFIIPNVLKITDQEKRIEELNDMAKQGKNVVCTDPKGELYGITSQTFRDAGYEVKVFNLVSPEHSDGIDLIKFIDKEIDAQVFAQVVISTTQNAGKKGEEFWQNTQENLLKALLLHIKFEVEDEDKKNMRYLNSILASGDIEKIDEVFKNSKGITKIAYNIYAQASDTIKQSTITGLATKLQIFQLNEIAAITEKNDIDFSELNDKKMIIYCITSDMDTTMSFLNSLFFSFLFIKAIRQADRNPDKKLKRHLAIFLDEFANIGQIPDFQQKLSTIRSRSISAVIVCQHIAGLKALYTNDVWQGLVGNCDIKIIMGTNDLLTAQYISDSLGVATVESRGNRKDAGFDGILEYGTQTTSSIKRNLLNADEIIRMPNDEQIIMIRGQKPFKCKKLRYWEYRLGNEIKETTLEDYNPEIIHKIKPIEDINIQKKLPTFDEFLSGRRKKH